MSREKMTYRQNLEELGKVFGDRHMITLKETADYLGVDPRTVRKHIPVIEGTKYVNLVNLASWLSC